jgi:hypothetical protein
MDLIFPFLAALVLLIVFATMILCGMKQYEDYKKRFPPISDAEFLANCNPETTPEVALKVRRIVSDNLGVEYERIYPSTRFAEDIGAD